jgi:large conductance mechanosensitive channel
VPRNPIGDPTMRGEFFLFLKNYGVIGLAIAVVIGGKLNALITTTVDGLIMPIVTFFIPGGDWRKATLDLGPFHLLPGPILAAGLDFLIVAWLVFIFAKKVLREDIVAKK